MAYKIAFYDTKPYDERSFTEANEKFGFDIRYYKGHLNMNNVVLTKGVDVVCIFVRLESTQFFSTEISVVGIVSSPIYTIS